MNPQPAASDTPRIHPTAIIEPGVEIGAGTAVWDHVHIRGPSRLGRDGIIGEKTYVAYGVTIGDYVKINAHVYVCTGVSIEDRVMVSAGVIFTNDRYPRAFSDAGGLASSEPTGETLHTIVQEGATLGAGALIGPGLAIGRFAMVGMGSVVVADIPAHGLVYGNPARLRGHVCICGVPLRGLSEVARNSDTETCARCRRTYTVSEDSSGLQLCFEERRPPKRRG